MISYLNEQKIKKMKGNELFSYAEKFSGAYFLPGIDSEKIENCMNKLLSNPKAVVEKYEQMLKTRFALGVEKTMTDRWDEIEDSEINLLIPKIKENLKVYADPHVIIYILEGISSNEMSQKFKEKFKNLIKYAMGLGIDRQLIAECLSNQLRRMEKLKYTKEAEVYKKSLDIFSDCINETNDDQLNFIMAK